MGLLAVTKHNAAACFNEELHRLEMAWRTAGEPYLPGKKAEWGSAIRKLRDQMTESELDEFNHAYAQEPTVTIHGFTAVLQRVVPRLF